MYPPKKQKEDSFGFGIRERGNSEIRAKLWTSLAEIALDRGFLREFWIVTNSTSPFVSGVRSLREFPERSACERTSSVICSIILDAPVCRVLNPRRREKKKEKIARSPARNGTYGNN